MMQKQIRYLHDFGTSNDAILVNISDMLHTEGYYSQQF